MILKIAVVYLLAINVFGFLLMGWDKGKAKRSSGECRNGAFFGGFPRRKSGLLVGHAEIPA